MSDWYEEMEQAEQEHEAQLEDEARAYRQGRIEAIDECIDELKPRTEWKNDIYAMAVRHCIELLEILKGAEQ